MFKRIITFFMLSVAHFLVTYLILAYSAYQLGEAYISDNGIMNSSGQTAQFVARILSQPLVSVGSIKLDPYNAVHVFTFLLSNSFIWAFLLIIIFTNVRTALKKSKHRT